MRRMRRLVVLIAVLASFAGFGATSAGAASPWVLTNLNLGDGETIFGMHCEASGFCIGVGAEGVMIQTTAPTAGATAWTVGHVSLGENLTGNLRGISCPSSTLCVAVDYSGGVWTTTNPALGPSGWVPAKIPKARALSGISCTSETSCVLVGNGGLIFASSNPTGGGAAWTRTVLPAGPPLRTVSCTGVLCVASAFNGEIWTTTNPAGGEAAWLSQGSPQGENPILGLTCANETFCVAGNEGNAVFSSAPTAGTAAWPFGPLQRRFQIVAAACPSLTLCILSSNNGEVSASTNPSGGWGSFVTEHLIGGVTNALFGLSCPSETLCVAAGKFGQMLTSMQPAATGLPEPPPPPPPPTNQLLHRPKKTVRLGVHTPAPTVSFAFTGSGVGPFWYRCKLDAKPATTCTVPLKARVGVGNHTFRFRSFGPGGGATSQLIYKFKVERAKPKPKPKPKSKPRKHAAGGKSTAGGH
jgi:hypothetical protein